MSTALWHRPGLVLVTLSPSFTKHKKKRQPKYSQAMLHPDSVAIKPQTGACYCHMEHPQENHSKNLREINPSAGRRSSEHENCEGWRRKQKEKDFKPTRDKGSYGSTWRQSEYPWMGCPEARLASNQQCLQDSSCIFSVGRYSRCAARPHFCYLLFEEVVFVGFSLSFRVWVCGERCPGMAPADN